MDLSIKLITPEHWQDRGYAAFLDGHGEHDHDLTDRSAVKHWKFGWHTARVGHKQDQQLVEAA